MIISDATTLIALIKIDALDIFKLFTEHITLPPEVYAEVTRKPYARETMDREIAQGFFTVESYEDISRFTSYRLILDAGESAAIVLAQEKNLPLIIDEKKGRNFARTHGVEIIGLVGILRFLYLQKRLNKEEIVILIRQLNDSDFRISKQLLDWIIA